MRRALLAITIAAALGTGITYAMQGPAPYDVGSVRTLAVMDEFVTMDGSYHMLGALDGSAGSTGTTDEGITAGGEYYIEIDSYNSTQNARVNELKQQFKAEIRGLLDHEGTAEYGIESDRILASYDGFFRVIIEHVLVSTNAGVWSEPEILAAIDYIFHETVKDEKLKINAESVPLADASSLYEQIRDGAENKDLECGNADHHMVIRHGLRLACVTPESASRMGWPEVIFSDNNDMTISSALEIEAGGKTFQVNYTLWNGIVQTAWYSEYLAALVLSIDSAGEGKVKLEIPQSLYAWLDEIEIWRSDTIEVMGPGWEEMPADVKFYRGQYFVEFTFPDTDPVVQLALVIVPW